MWTIIGAEQKGNCPLQAGGISILLLAGGSVCSNDVHLRAGSGKYSNRWFWQGFVLAFGASMADEFSGRTIKL